jgi:hypothetical protein
MPRLSAHVGPLTRARVDAFAASQRLTNAEALRILIVLGLGGSLANAEALNQSMRARKEAAERFHGRKRTPGARERAPSSEPAQVVTVRLPAVWAKRAQEAGLRAVIEEGLTRL